MSAPSRILAAITLVFAAIGAAGCGPDFGSLSFAKRTSPPAETVIDFDGIEIRVGIAAGVIVTPLDDDGDQMDEETTVDLNATDTKVVGVDPVLEPGSFVIYGVSPGNTTISVEVDGSHEANIPVTVTLQEP
jgi:hypothetical protein